MQNEKPKITEEYLEQMVEGSGPDGLILLLVEGAVKFIRRGLFALEKEELDHVHENLIKAQNIYIELVISMDLDAGDFAMSLAEVYQFLYNLLIEANLDKDRSKIESGLKLAEDIRDLWKDTVEKARKQAVEPLPIELNSAMETVEQVAVAKADSVVYGRTIKPELPNEPPQSRLNITG